MDHPPTHPTNNSAHSYNTSLRTTEWPSNCLLHKTLEIPQRTLTHVHGPPPHPPHKQQWTFLQSFLRTTEWPFNSLLHKTLEIPQHTLRHVYRPSSIPPYTQKKIFLQPTPMHKLNGPTTFSYTRHWKYPTHLYTSLWNALQPPPPPPSLIYYNKPLPHQPLNITLCVSFLLGQ